MSRKATVHQRINGLRLRPLILALGAALPLLALQPAEAAPFNIAEVPLWVGGSLEPNLMYIHDDSGSMYRSFLPDGIGNGYQRGTSSAYNIQYYNPAVTYLPPVDESGTSLGNASFTAAWFNGYDLAGRASNTVNLSSNFRPTWDYDGTWVSGTPVGGEPAFYHVFSPPRTGCTTAAQMVPSTNACYVKVVLPAAQQQNFANWYSYYRTRAYSAKAGVSRAFATIDGGIRVGYGRINKGTNSTIDGKSLPVIQRGVRAFEGASRKEFYDWLFGVVSSGSTPLRRSLNAAGQYFENDHATGPWSTTPGVAGGNHLSCRKSFTILMTDGYWNGPSPGLGNVDNTGGPTVTGPNSQSHTYVAKSPFNDDHSDTLADVAMYYWKRDLSSLPNRVPTTSGNPAFWQHMVTMPIGFGVTGTVSKEAAFDAITSGAAITWPAPTTNPGKADDLLHAAVNGRGDYFSANNPQAFEEELKRALASVNAKIGSSSGAVVSSPYLDADTLIYKALFDSSDWTGEYLAYEFDTDKKPKLNPKWKASEQIPSHSLRKIFTWRTDESRGADFLWGDLSGGQQSELQTVDILQYLRGDQSKEGTGAGQFRKRNSVLGDIVNSTAAIVGTQDFGYGNATGLPQAQRDAYKTRRNSAAYKNRSKTLYVGANDGMLHAFNAQTGAERFAYVPNALFADGKLAKLSDKNYTHSYYVDGSPAIGDAYLDSSWRTILVGSTGAGGRAYFALDADDPVGFNKGKVMWEFTDPELGFAVGQASIVRTESGAWVAIFGNGYNSDSHRAQLFIVNLQTGALLKQFDTGVGTAASPNGLSRPVAIDSNLNGNADLVYAGDMQGNLWKFDISGNVADWTIAYEGGGSPKPLFKAVSSTAAVQPIQGAPNAARFSARGKPEIMVYFGTGKFLEVGDQGALNPVNSLYGVIDECGVKYLTPGSLNTARPGGCDSATGAAKVLRSNLLKQEIILEQMNRSFADEDGNTFSHDIRLVSNNTMSASHRGFYLDLIPPSPASAQGERYIQQPRISNDRVQYITMVPDPDPCSAGGVSWFMEIDPASGGRTKHSVFDLNNDGQFNGDEFVTNPLNPSEKIPVSGRRSAGGIVNEGTGEVEDQGCVVDSSGAIVCADENRAQAGRRSWQQIR